MVCLPHNLLGGVDHMKGTQVRTSPFPPHPNWLAFLEAIRVGHCLASSVSHDHHQAMCSESGTGHHMANPRA